MNAPRALNSRDSLKLVRTAQVAMLVSILIYVFLIWRIPARSHPQNSTIYAALTVLALSSVVVLFALRRFFAARLLAALSANLEDTAALVQWRASYVISYAVSESIAIYGLLLHFLGFSMKQVAPFLIAGFLLILFLAPSLPKPDISSGPIQRL